MTKILQDVAPPICKLILGTFYLSIVRNIR